MKYGKYTQYGAKALYGAAALYATSGSKVRPTHHHHHSAPKRVVHQISNSDHIRQTFAKVRGSKLSPSDHKLFDTGNKAEYQYVAGFTLATNVGVSTDPSKHYVQNLQLLGDGTGITGTLVPLCFNQNAGEAAIAPGTYNAGMEILMRRYEINVEFVNMSPGSQFVTLYFVKSNGDTAVTTTGTPSVAWETAVDEVSGLPNSLTTNSSLWPFGRPTPNKGFRDRWTTVHTFDCTLNPGEGRRHTVQIGVNKKRTYADILHNPGFVHGITHYVFMVARGLPADTLNTPVGGTVMFAPSKIVGVIGTKQHITCAERPSKVLGQFTNLPTVGVASLFSINDDSGAAVNVNQAAGYG